MSVTLFLAILLLVTLSTLIMCVATYYTFKILLQQVTDAQHAAITQMWDDLDDEEPIDKAFRTSPIGIPPSLARD